MISSGSGDLDCEECKWWWLWWGGGAWVVRVFTFFFALLVFEWWERRGLGGGCCWRGRCSMVATVAGVAIGGWLVVGWPVGGGGGGLECEEVFLLFFSFIYLFFFFFKMEVTYYPKLPSCSVCLEQIQVKVGIILSQFF